MATENCGIGTGEPYTRQQPKIADRCPTCGAQSLFIGPGGWLTCGVIGCKEPGVSVAWDATRARLAQAERERDEARTTAFKERAVVVCNDLHRTSLALAESQAGERELLALVERMCRIADWAKDTDAYTAMQELLSRAPGSTEALRAVLLKAWKAGGAMGSAWMYGHIGGDVETAAAHIDKFCDAADGIERHFNEWVARVLDRSDTTEGGRG